MSPAAQAATTQIKQGISNRKKPTQSDRPTWLDVSPHLVLKQPSPGRKYLLMRSLECLFESADEGLEPNTQSDQFTRTDTYRSIHCERHTATTSQKLSHSNYQTTTGIPSNQTTNSRRTIATNPDPLNLKQNCKNSCLQSSPGGEKLQSLIMTAGNNGRPLSKPIVQVSDLLAAETSEWHLNTWN